LGKGIIMTKKGFLLATAATGAAAFAPGAMAADLPTKAPAPLVVPPAASWAGWYIGLHAGVNWQQGHNTPSANYGATLTTSSTGFIGGGQIGYNVQAGNIVFGIEATLSGSNLGDDYRSVVNPVVTYSTDVNWIGTVAGRLGVAHDRFLAYVKAGWATANIEVAGNNPGFPDAFSIDDRRNGWVIGGGLEVLVSRNLSLGIEYNHIDLGSASYVGTTRAGIPFTIRDVDMDVQSVTARVNFKFGGDHARPLK